MSYSSPSQSREVLEGPKRMTKTKVITKEPKPSKELIRSGMNQEPCISFQTMKESLPKRPKLCGDSSVEIDCESFCQSKSVSTALNSELPE